MLKLADLRLCFLLPLFRNELSQGVAWHASTGLTRTASVLSFDGLGYLFTERFGTEPEFGASFFQIITLYLRPNDASRGLVMYAYQTEVYTVTM